MEEKRTEKQETAVQEEAAPKRKNDWKVIRLSKAVMHMGNPVRELDLTGLDSLTLDDMTELYNLYEELGGTGTIMQESSLLFAKLVMQRLTGLTMETLGQIPAKDAVKLKNRLYRFFYMSV